MPEMRACDVPGSWRILRYVGALSGSCNVYRCCWLPRWLRCLSIVWQLTMLFTYVILIAVAMADSGSTNIFNQSLNRYAILIQYITIILLNIVFVWQTSFGSGLFDFFLTWKAFQRDNSYSTKHKLRRGAIIVTVGLIVLICGLAYICSISWYLMQAGTFAASYMFPALEGHFTQMWVFRLHVIIQVPHVMFICSYMLLCFVVLFDLTFLFRTIREEMRRVFSVPIVDDATLKKCLHSISCICDLVDAANGTFGTSLAIYLLWNVTNIINKGLQLIQWQDEAVIVFLPGLIYNIGILFLTLVPPAVLAAQVRPLSVAIDDFVR